MIRRFDMLTYNIWWNLFLISLGTAIYSAGLKGIVIHHGFVPGGIFGFSMLLYYLTPVISAGIIYFLLNIPLFVLGWLHVSKRFFYYSLYAMVFASLSYELLEMDFGIKDQLYAAIAAGGICGFGVGLVLRTLGSNGGLDVVAVILNQKFNIGIGKTYFVYNVVLFGTCLVFIEADLVIASLILVFMTSVVLEQTLSLFNQRKMVLIISSRNEEIAEIMVKNLNIGATYLRSRGVYSGQERNIIMAITNNIVLKKLEELVFSKDENAIFIVENTFNVLGSSFTKRKIY
ncbi:YitT family protein [bacterium]|nr:YitT family protein [bacterium]